MRFIITLGLVTMVLMHQTAFADPVGDIASPVANAAKDMLNGRSDDTFIHVFTIASIAVVFSIFFWRAGGPMMNAISGYLTSGVRLQEKIAENDALRVQAQQAAVEVQKQGLDAQRALNEVLERLVKEHLDEIQASRSTLNTAVPALEAAAHRTVLLLEDLQVRVNRLEVHLDDVKKRT